MPKGLPRIRFHDLRHTCATLFLQQGEHPKVVQERLGHSGVGITLDLYSHIVPGLQRQATSRLMQRLLTLQASPPGADKPLSDGIDGSPGGSGAIRWLVGRSRRYIEVRMLLDR